MPGAKVPSERASCRADVSYSLFQATQPILSIDIALASPKVLLHSRLPVPISDFSFSGLVSSQETEEILDIQYDLSITLRILIVQLRWLTLWHSDQFFNIEQSI